MGEESPVQSAWESANKVFLKSALHHCKAVTLDIDATEIIQSLLVTCKLEGVDPYTYLVDVLQRVDQYPTSKVIELMQRVCKEKFADNPLRFDLRQTRKINGLA